LSLGFIGLPLGQPNTREKFGALFKVPLTRIELGEWTSVKIKFLASSGVATEHHIYKIEQSKLLPCFID